MRFPDKLTEDEWNLLYKLTSYNHMDDWFELRHSDDADLDVDYVRDLDTDDDMNLHDAIQCVAEGGVYKDDIDRFDNGREIWNGLMEKFALQCYKFEKEN